MHKLLSGIKVIDLTTIVLGPYATQFIGDFGASVVKIEAPGGDLFRAVRPGRSRHMGAGYLNLNRNKSSVVIDLKTDEGREEIYELVKSADVVVHNMRVSSAKNLGVDFASLREIQPGLIYCSAPGYGSDGPNANEPAYDDIIQAASGLAELNKNADGDPRFLPTIVCDKVGGLHLALGIVAAIAHKARTGEGCEIEIPMFESMVSFLMAEQMAGRTFVPPIGTVGYDRLLSPNRRPFKTKDGFVSLLPYSSRHWKKFLTLVDRLDIADEEWVQDPVKRSENIDRLYRIVVEEMPKRTTAQWLEELRQLDIPSSPVNSLSDLFDDEHLKAVGLFVSYEHPDEGALLSVRSPFRVLSGADEANDSPPPGLSPSVNDE
jgi:crotonobetainyl-CoA:carnitine CoA-transferase CaiB-like acyl-CoA transferase